jgi:hypothetical protein
VTDLDARPAAIAPDFANLVIVTGIISGSPQK